MIRATTPTQAHDGHRRDFTEVVEAFQDVSGAVKRDLQELWRRVVISIAGNNSDNHLLNSDGHLRERGWCLSPMFDVSPNLYLGTARSTSIDSVAHHEPALGALRGEAEYFDVEVDSAHEVWEQITHGITEWREVAVSNGIEVRGLRRSSDVFGEVEHS